MDPEETLSVIRAHVAALLDTDLSREELTDHAMAAAEAMRNLDVWLQVGGLLPASWAAQRYHA